MLVHPCSPGTLVPSGAGNPCCSRRVLCSRCGISVPAPSLLLQPPARVHRRCPRPEGCAGSGDAAGQSLPCTRLPSPLDVALEQRVPREPSASSSSSSPRGAAGPAGSGNSVCWRLAPDESRGAVTTTPPGTHREGWHGSGLGLGNRWEISWGLWELLGSPRVLPGAASPTRGGLPLLPAVPGKE